jgi:feruloyl esterase
VVKSVVSCDQLAKADLRQAVGVSVTIKSATEFDTEKGKYCKVSGTIAPAVGFEVDLPMEHWTQRYLEGGCGGMCGSVRASIETAGSCMPALNGEFVVAGDDMGHSGGMGGPGGGAMGSFGADPDARIDFAYRANHETTLAAKALIKIFYGQPQKYSYFVGCSDGGREALAEAERYPNDFDGISAGAPVLLFSLHNSFFHGWEGVINKRADGSPILLRSRMSMVHDAVVAHCPTLSGVQDGLLEDPFGCKFDPAWVQCAPGAADNSKCLTAEETAALQNYYDGPTDAQGHYFTISGYALGSELLWNLPNGADTGRGGPGGGMAGGNIKYLIMPTVLSDDELAKFSFTEDWFNKVSQVGASLYNAGNTNLRPFEQHGGKLIMWHGLADDSVPPAMSVAFYQGVQKQLGEKVTDSFLHLFLIPGVGHCGGGQGFPQVDVLGPLMAWTEMKEAPQMIVAGRTANQQMGRGGPNMAGGRGPGPGAPGQGGQRGPGGPGGGQASRPYAQPAQPTVAKRPVYPYPYVAKYKGTGGTDDAASYLIRTREWRNSMRALSPGC